MEKDHPDRGQQGLGPKTAVSLIFLKNNEEGCHE